MKALLMVVLALVGCQTSVVSVPPASQPAQSTPTRWVRARSAAGASLLEAPARVLGSPESAAAVSVPLAARVLRVRVRAGEAVLAQAVLFDVLMPELLAAAGSFAAAQIKIEAYGRRKAQLESLRQEGLARVSELAEVEAQLSSARADGQAARALLRAAGLSDAQGMALLSGDGALSLRAPIAGIVTVVDAMTGEVRDATGKPLAQIIGVGDGRVEARLQSAPIAGARFVFVGPAGTAPLKLISVSPRVEPSDGSRLAWFGQEEDAKVPLQIGQAGRVRMVGDASWQAIPARAVLGDDKTQVLVRQGDLGVLTSVQVLSRSGAEALVVGLAAGVEVAADATAGAAQ